ncbi:ribonuclease P protein component [Thiomicrospira sp. ALE5]|uniref:ribonuclease P protein component n=1 Tax=Thiomicrospira sp. ALE5 TaxID=748650 RepID=UPI0008E5485D|nr:ribonuclease P protein component [Thiomicrospira sp. ALE5]SFR56521.1 ribonuclease P protein component [Thiomicrospira sp. ALE5]
MTVLSDSHPIAVAAAPSDALARQTFPKTLRLLTPKQYKQAFEQAQKFANRHWTLIVKANQQPIPRLGLAISKKQLARAVWRNRIKRVAREAFRQHKIDLCGYDIVVLGRKGMERVDSAQLHASFEHLIKKIKLSELNKLSVKEQA